MVCAGTQQWRIDIHESRCIRLLILCWRYVVVWQGHMGRQNLAAFNGITTQQGWIQGYGASAECCAASLKGGC